MCRSSDQLTLDGVQEERPRPLGHQKAAAESACRGSIGVRIEEGRGGTGDSEALRGRCIEEGAGVR